MALTAAQQIQAVQARAKREVGDQNDLQAQEHIASLSHDGSMAVGAVIASTGGWVGLAAYGAGLTFSELGVSISERAGADKAVTWVLGKAGMQPVGQGEPHPATQGHQVAHTYAFAGFLATIAAGVAVAAVVVATGGVGAVVLISAAAAGGFAAGFIGSAIGGALSQMGSRTGPITSGSPNVFIEGKPAARMTDEVTCSKEGKPQPIIQGRNAHARLRRSRSADPGHFPTGPGALRVRRARPAAA